MADYGDLSAYGADEKRLKKILDSHGFEKLRKLKVVGPQGKLKEGALDKLLASYPNKKGAQVDFLKQAKATAAAGPSKITEPVPTKPLKKPGLPPPGRIARTPRDQLADLMGEDKSGMRPDLVPPSAPPAAQPSAVQAAAPPPVAEPAAPPGIGGDLSQYGNKAKRIQNILGRIDEKALRQAGVIGNQGNLRPDGLMALANSGLINNRSNAGFLAGLAGGQITATTPPDQVKQIQEASIPSGVYQAHDAQQAPPPSQAAPPPGGGAPPPGGGGAPPPPPAGGGGAPPPPPVDEPPPAETLPVEPPPDETGPIDNFTPEPTPEEEAAWAVNEEQWTQMMDKFANMERQIGDWTQGGAPPERPGWGYSYKDQGGGPTDQVGRPADAAPMEADMAYGRPHMRPGQQPRPGGPRPGYSPRPAGGGIYGTPGGGYQGGGGIITDPNTGAIAGGMPDHNPGGGGQFWTASGEARPFPEGRPGERPGYGDQDSGAYDQGQRKLSDWDNRLRPPPDEGFYGFPPNQPPRGGGPGGGVVGKPMPLQRPQENRYGGGFGGAQRPMPGRRGMPPPGPIARPMQRQLQQRPMQMQAQGRRAY